jgi:hypothetical protein
METSTQAGDHRTGFFGFVEDQATLARVMASGGAGATMRMRTLREVAAGQITPNPESRLGAFAATVGYPEGTVGYSVNRAIGLLYVAFGTYGEERIGTVFNSATARAHYPNRVDGPSTPIIADMEYQYWARVRREDPWAPGPTIATAFDAKTRGWLMREVFGR